MTEDMMMELRMEEEYLRGLEILELMQEFNMTREEAEIITDFFKNVPPP